MNIQPLWGYPAGGCILIGENTTDNTPALSAYRKSLIRGVGRFGRTDPGKRHRRIAMLNHVTQDRDGLAPVLEHVMRSDDRLADAVLQYLARSDSRPVQVRLRRLVRFISQPVAVGARDALWIAIGPWDTQADVERELRAVARGTRGATVTGLTRPRVRWSVQGARLEVPRGWAIRSTVRDQWAEIERRRMSLRAKVDRADRIRRRKPTNPVTDWAARHLLGESYPDIAGDRRSWQAVQRSVLSFWRLRGVTDYRRMRGQVRRLAAANARNSA